MSASLYNDWYVSPTSSEVGPSHGSYTNEQKHNATKIYNVLKALNWELEPISAVLGNIQIESWLNPADATPTIGNTLAGIGNTTASQHPDNAYGLLQWKGRGETDPDNNQLVGYAMRHGYEWYDGDIQMERLTWEFQSNKKFHAQTVDGVYYTFASFASSTGSVDALTKAWMVCYEGTYSSLSYRQENAEYWYNYFSEEPGPTPVTGWIGGDTFSQLATAYDPDITGQDIPYSELDCYGFVQKVWRDIDVVTATDTLCNPASNHSGTNTLWRMNMSPYQNWTFNTTSPDNQNPTPVLWYKDTIDNCISIYGEIPAGTLLFHKIGEDDNPQIPSYYRGDGIGNYAHVGIYIGNNQVMQSGGRDSSSVPGGGVHRSTYDSSAWNYCAFVVWVDPTEEPGPGPEPGQNVPVWMMWWYNKQKEVVKNVKRLI